MLWPVGYAITWKVAGCVTLQISWMRMAAAAFASNVYVQHWEVSVMFMSNTGRSRLGKDSGGHTPRNM
jgi:hypothetical protein